MTSFAPSLFDGFADFYCEIWLSLGEGLWTVLVSENRSVLRSTLLRQLPYEFGVRNCEFDGLLL